MVVQNQGERAVPGERAQDICGSRVTNSASGHDLASRRWLPPTRTLRCVASATSVSLKLPAHDLHKNA